MKKFTFIPIFLLLYLLQSCTSTQLIQQGETAYLSQNYSEALKAWDTVIESKESKGKNAKAPVYVKAGISALTIEQDNKARKYLETARELQYSSPELYSSLAKIYKKIDNLSKEITALETYNEKYPQGEEIDKIRIRLFETYVESANWEPAQNLWPDIEEKAQSNTSLLAGYLVVNKNLEKENVCKKLAQKILKLDSKNIIALEWYAESYFWKAENLYVSEMKAYKNHRTRSQYNKLLKALDKVYPNYRKSRDYFLKLYKLEPKPGYAKHLGNIYTRLDNKQKAKYYKKRAN